MTGFGKVSPGDPTDLIKSARYHNAIIDVLNNQGQLTTSEPFPDPFGRQVAVVRVKNPPPAVVPWGGVLGVGAVVVDADDNEGHFLDADPCFVGVAPVSDIHQARFVVALGPIAVGKIGPCVAVGWVSARVDISDTSHTTAKISDGDVTKLVSASAGAVPIVPAQSGAGEKWAMINLAGAASSGGECVLGISTGGTAAKYESGNITPGCITVKPSESPPRYSMSSAYVYGNDVAESPNYHSALRSYSADNPDAVAVSAPAWVSGTTYSEGDQVAHPAPGLDQTGGKLWEVTSGDATGEPGFAGGWNVAEHDYQPVIWVATANHAPGAWDHDDTTGWEKLGTDCSRLSRYRAGGNVPAVPLFSIEDDYDAGDNVRIGAKRYEANAAVVADENNDPAVDAAWDEVEPFDAYAFGVRQKTLNKEGAAVTWSHGMMFAPGDGHYVNGVDGVLTWYDCRPLPDQTCDHDLLAWGVVAEDIPPLEVPAQGTGECYSLGTGKVYLAKLVGSCWDLQDSRPDSHPPYIESQTYSTEGERVIHEGIIYKLREGESETGTFDASAWDDEGAAAVYHDSDDDYEAGDRVIYGGRLLERVNPCGDYVDSNNECDNAGTVSLPGDPGSVTCDEGGTCLGPFWTVKEDLAKEATNISKVTIPAGTVVQLTGEVPPYAATFANPDEHLAMLPSYTTGATQSLYHPPGVRQAIWGGEYCGNDYQQFSTSSLYAVGDMVEYQGAIYVNTTAIGEGNPPGPFDEDDWGNPFDP